MKFRTEFNLKPVDFSISHVDKLFFLGSCFAENIGQCFKDYKFKTTINPFGILYHPLAIKNSVDIALNENFEPSKHMFCYNEIWSHYDAHSKLSKNNKTELIKALQQAKSETKDCLENANIVFITLGTAWVYRNSELDHVVANCHKLPQKNFIKEILSLNQVQEALSDIVNQTSTINPKVKIIFTLSPVRHLKDGFVDNQLSKSILHLAIQNTVKRYNQAAYFPSYELLLDDLRDYRYYKNDMLHPNDLAIDYIWSKVSDMFFNDITRGNLITIEKITKRLNHRFFNPKNESSLKFNQETKRLIGELESKIERELF